jgi:hypothetical protein
MVKPGQKAEDTAPQQEVFKEFDDFQLHEAQK